MFGISNGFRDGSTMSENVFTIKIYKDYSNSFIGIVSNIDVCKYKHQGFGGLSPSSTKDERRSHRYYKSLKQCKANDVITIQVDMDEKWIIRYFCNDRVWGDDENIEQQKMYYPVIQTRSDSKYSLILH